MMTIALPLQRFVRIANDYIYDYIVVFCNTLIASLSDLEMLSRESFFNMCLQIFINCFNEGFYCLMNFLR